MTFLVEPVAKFLLIAEGPVCGNADKLCGNGYEPCYDDGPH